MTPSRTKEIEFIIKSLRAAAGGRRVSINEFDTVHLDWTWILEISDMNLILPFIGLYWETENSLSLFPAQAQETIQLYTLYSKGMAAKRLEDFKKVALLLNHSQIPVIPIKGISLLLTVYKNMPYRLMTDIDVLILKKDLFSAECLLRRDHYWPHSADWSGLSSRYRWRDSLFPRDIYGSASFSKDGSEVDLHWNPHYFVGDTRIGLNVEDFLTRAFPCPEIAPNVRLLSQRDLFDVVFFHALDFHSPSLLQILDMGLLINHYKITLDHILEKKLPNIPSVKRPSWKDFLKMLEEIFVTSSNTFASSTYQILEDIINFKIKESSQKKGLPPKKRSSLDYLFSLKSAKDRGLFVAGYFFPNPEYYAPDKGLKMHLRHWKEIIERVLNFLIKARQD